MPTLCPEKECTSCMACVNACPFDAIFVIENSLSIKVPKIDDSKCRECGICEKTCPIITKPTSCTPTKAIAAYTNDTEDRRTCSSGGAGTAFAKQVIEEGGVVYGATSEGGTFKFMRVSSLVEIDKLKGSKYVYCDPDLIYREVKNDLKLGLRVLFIGLPCNIAGLKNYLKANSENLLTIDLVCHGTPPSEYLIQHLNSKIRNAHDIMKVTFRGECDFHTLAYDSHSRVVYKKTQLEDEYFTAFMGGAILRPSCYSCKFAKPQRVSDITIADFWGIAPTALNGYTGKKSLILLNTKRGESFFSESAHRFIWELRDLEEAIAGNDQLRHPSPEPESARLFRKCYSQTGSFKEAFKASRLQKRINKNKLRRIVLTIPKLIRSYFR